MQAAGDIYLSKYSGWYSVRDEAYYDEGELTAAADGGRLAPTGSPVEWVEEESYFFRLSAYADRLLRHYEEHPDFVTPEKYKNELVAFIKRGLSDLSISRTTFAGACRCRMTQITSCMCGSMRSRTTLPRRAIPTRMRHAQNFGRRMHM